MRFIFVKRNIDDNLVRIYFTEFHKGNSYAYDLAAAREHLLWYHQMIDATAEKLPDLVRIVHYEDMVHNPAAVVEMVAELCGLPMRHGPLPTIGDDRGCGEPYRQFIDAELAGKQVN